MIIKDAPSLRDAPVAVVLLVLEGDLDIRRSHDFVLPFLTGKERVAWAEIDGRPVACEVWSVRDEGRIWYVDVTYVHPEFRGRGIISSVLGHVRKLAHQDSRVQFIESLVAFDNKAMLKRMARGGATPANYHYRYYVRVNTNADGGHNVE